MTFPVLSANGPSGYNLTRSLRTRKSASAYLSRAISTSGSRTTFTFSAWIKRGLFGNANLLGNSTLSNGEAFDFDGDNLRWTSYNVGNVYTSAVYRDPSAWYHIVFVLDTTNATASSRVRMYVNGAQITSFSSASYPSQNSSCQNINTAGVTNYIASNFAATGYENYYDGYMTEVNFIDGQALTPSSFGSTNATTGVWQPAAYTGTYGTNGFYLPFTNITSTTTLGYDSSGNGNNWTTNNISLTAGATYDSMTDVPTLTSATAANFAVLNPLACGSYIILSSANLQATGSATDQAVVSSTMQITTPSYWECTVITKDGGGNFPRFGAVSTFPANWNSTFIASSTTGGVAYRGNGDVVKNSNVAVGTFTALAANDVLGFALHPTNQTCAIYLNNSLQVTVTGITGPYFPAVESYTTSGVGVVNFGQRPFSYTPPSGFVALNTYNLPASTVPNGAAYMAATTYTGTLLSNTIANTVGSASFQPDLVWIKSRSAATDNKLTDVVRGVTKGLISNTTAAETTDTQGLTAFGSTGFTVGTNTDYNNLAATYVAWQWKGGGTAVSNTNGSITSSVSANTTSGCSVVTWTSPASGVPTIGHGLGVAPTFIIVKDRTTAYNWDVGCDSIGWANRLNLNTTNLAYAGYWNSTAPTSSVFTYTAAGANSGDAMVAYCFTPIKGFSAFGKYTANASADGPFVYTGFRPRWVMVKNSTTATYNWFAYDSSRNTYNVTNTILIPNDPGAEQTNTSWSFDFLSNGFKIRGTSGNVNNSSDTYIYAAFAESPFQNSLAR